MLTQPISFYWVMKHSIKRYCDYKLKSKVMFNKQLVSVRLEKEVLDAIDQYSVATGYYTRSDVICALLKAAVEAVIFEDGKLKNKDKNLFRVKMTADF